MKTKISSIPKYTVDVSTLSAPADMMRFFQQHDIVAYVYEIVHSGMTLKFGQSMGSDNRAFLGERLYRQIGHEPVNGWKTPLTGDNSKEFKDICNDYTKLTSKEVNKNNIITNIYDMTKYEFECDWNPRKEVVRFEAELIDCFKQTHGHMPLGNKTPELYALHLDINVTSATLQTFFDYTPKKITIP